MNKTVMTREMATQFIDIYHKTVRIHQYETNYILTNYTDEFYEGCMSNTPLFTQIRSMTDIDAYPFVQTVYDAIHILMSPGYCLTDNIKYCNNYVNIDPRAVTYLNAANLNYHVIHKIYTTHYYNLSVCYEDLSDATLEPNTCSVCQYENNTKPAESQYLKKFYYSTAFSLNTPVCQDCVLYDDVEEDPAKAEQKDPDYKPFVVKRVTITEDTDDDSASIDAVDAYSITNEPTGLYDLDAEVDSYDEVKHLNENIVLTSTYSTMPYYYDVTESSNNTGSMSNDAQCYSLGWEGGWAAAMKYMEEHSSKAPRCDYCGEAGKTKKCGGTCNGQVRYCSVECQTADWKQVHKYACLKNTF